MTDGARCRSNQRLRKVLHPIVKGMYPGTKFKSGEIADRKDLSSHREINSYTVGSLLKEMDVVKSHGHGVWERVEA
jgi:hypothetical protein